MRKGGAYAVDLDIIGDSCADWFAVLDAGRRLGGFWEGSVLPEPAAWPPADTYSACQEKAKVRRAEEGKEIQETKKGAAGGKKEGFCFGRR